MPWLLLIILFPYLYLLMRIYSGLLSVKQFQPEKQGASFLSVVVPCRNEEANLPFLLSDIARQTLDNNLFELIIVDDNSCDSTFRKASDSYNQGNIKVIRNRGIGKKTAIRTGVEESAGELIITIDADCRINGTFLETISSCYAESAPALIICPVALESGRSFFQRFQELEFLSLQGVTAGSALRGDPVMCNGAGLGFTKEAYLSHSDFLHYELASGDDVFLLHSLKKESPKSIRWIESDDAAVTTRLSGSVASFLRQRARWISKTGYYSDTSAKILAIVTFVTILSQLAILVAGIFSQVILLVFVAFVALK
jgi:glycosyltransferase involved in cell wall biosynthesis